MSTLLTGRGLWYGARTFGLDEWDKACAQAKSWGIQIVHPKVAEGAYLWYDKPTMQELQRIASSLYHLQVVPYHFCYGDHFGALHKEANIDALIGSIFGAVSPDMEDVWAGQDTWARDYGDLLRHQYGYTGPVYPTVYANPEQHPTPIGAMNTWATGFLPQVYFSLWYPKTAANAISYVDPQWKRLEAVLKAKHQVLKPILPIISLGNGLPAAEVAHWLENMGGYGYCGFWYDQEYAPYVEIIRTAPMPRFATLASSPKQEAPMATVSQNLSENELKILWHRENAQIPWNPKAVIQHLWELITQNHPEIDLGAPTTPEKTTTVEGEDIIYQMFSYGKQIIYFKKSGKVCVY